jgi:lipopolysaccharide/colanic/teichoic acid biosynthesis glycosyltransferase
MRRLVGLGLAAFDFGLAVLLWHYIVDPVHLEVPPHFFIGLTWIFTLWMVNGYVMSPFNLWPPVSRPALLASLATLGFGNTVNGLFELGYESWTFLYFIAVIFSSTVVLRFIIGNLIMYLRSKSFIPHKLLYVMAEAKESDLLRVGEIEKLNFETIVVTDAEVAIGNIEEKILKFVDENSISAVIVDFNVPLEDQTLAAIAIGLEEKHVDLVKTGRAQGKRTPFLHFWSNHVVSVVQLSEPKLTFPNVIFKSVSDFFWSVIGLIVFIIPMLLIAIRLKVQNPSMTITTQRHALGPKGKNVRFREFNVFAPGVDAFDVPVNSMLNRNSTDDCFSNFGKFLRKHSLEELPMIFAALAGRIALIGPRPVFLAETDPTLVPSRRRLLMKPGLTGLWVLSDSVYHRNEELMHLAYVEHWSLGSDLKILLLTLLRMYRGGIRWN